jgi:hypothetical protein
LINSLAAKIFYSTNNNSAIEEQLIIETNNIDTEGDRFGSSHSISSDKILIGVPNDQKNGSRTGSAKIYQKLNGVWLQQHELIASDGDDNDLFGAAVELMTDQAIVSAIGDDTNGMDAGSVYFFKEGTGNWQENQKLFASDGFTGDGFGTELCIVADTLFVSAKINNSAVTSTVYVFRFDGSNWIEQQKLNTGQKGDNFGLSMVATIDKVFISAPGENKVYIYIQNNGSWVFQQVITIPSGDFGLEFGTGLAVNSGHLILTSKKVVTDVGGFNFLTYNLHRYIEQRNNWLYIDTTSQFVVADASGLPFVSVGMENDNVVMSVHTFRDSFIYTAVIYFYNMNQTSLSRYKVVNAGYLEAVDAKMPVSIENDFAYVGVSSDTTNGTDAGAIRTFNFNPPDSIFADGFE